ncbi:methyltransferase family protein [Orbus hercynius]|uniref:Methyltransferase family protein n=1 Tax=Orbus hercynius TaxID=593135 RepID=A0A495RJ81_9GAMM|nr:class I SAM-dependent methyltransferase [Orbus hercynius]RKS87429.1 methyltransferase family protein [Orbus hercynius]
MDLTPNNDALLNSVTDYWNNRAEGYSESNIAELNSHKRDIWLNIILNLAPKKPVLRVLDIGTGPGFFAIILAKAGHNVTAVDATLAMLNQAEANATQQDVKIQFVQSDVHHLPFDDNQFDLIVSRNVTWNLKDPLQAYQEWYRVLDVNGRMITFDANWYLHLFNEHFMRGFKQDRLNTQQHNVNDHYVNTDTKAMEAIARQLPFSQQLRPQWDAKALLDIGFDQLLIDKNISEQVWDTEEKINYGSTPMFVITAQK